MIGNASIKCSSPPWKINDDRSLHGSVIISMWSVSVDKTFKAYQTYSCFPRNDAHTIVYLSAINSTGAQVHDVNERLKERV